MRVPRERKWEDLLPAENVPEYRFPPVNFSSRCTAHGLRDRIAGEPRSTRKIFFVNTYNNEIDLLHMKLDEIYPVVDYIVLIEGQRTFQHSKKPIYFSFNDTQFEKYHDKLIHRTYDYLPSEQKIRQRSNKVKWAQEVRSRQEGFRAVRDLIKHDDIVISADVDEIVRREALQLLRDCSLDSDRDFPMAFEMHGHYYSFQYRSEKPWRAPFAVSFGPTNRYAAFDRMQPRKTSRLNITNAGWHCSWFLTPQEMQLKLTSFSHSEYNAPPFNQASYIEWSICQGKTFWNGGRLLIRMNLVRLEITSCEFCLRNAGKQGWRGCYLGKLQG